MTFIKSLFLAISAEATFDVAICPTHLQHHERTPHTCSCPVASASCAALAAMGTMMLSPGIVKSADMTDGNQTDVSLCREVLPPRASIRELKPLRVELTLNCGSRNMLCMSMHASVMCSSRCTRFTRPHSERSHGVLRCQRHHSMDNLPCRRGVQRRVQTLHRLVRSNILHA